MKNVCILGGGLSGLSSAWKLSKLLPKTSKIITSRMGGYIQSLPGDSNVPFNVVLEQGPHSIRHNPNDILPFYQMLSSLNLEDKIITANDSLQTKYVFFDNKVTEMPRKIKDFVFSPLGRLVLRGILLDVSRLFSKQSSDDETVDSFLTRRFGRRFSEVLGTSMVHGIFAGESTKLSVRSCFPRLVDLEKNYNSVFVGALLKRNQPNIENYSMKTQELFQKIKSSGAFSLKGGLETIIKTLEHQLEVVSNVCILKESECVKLERSSTGWNVDIRGKNNVESKYFHQNIISAIPSFSLSKILSNRNPQLKELLASIPFNCVGLINLVFEKSKIKKKGFGYLIPSNSLQSPAIGVLFYSTVFPDNCSSLEVVTVMMKGENLEQKLNFFFDQNQQKTLTIENKMELHSLEIMKEHLGITETPLLVKSRLIEKCIPQYVVGHDRTVKKIEEIVLENYGTSLQLIGNSYKSVSIYDCVRYAFEAVDTIIQ